jgi:RNA polymerase sigma factor (sigma-70 family)
VVFWPPPWRGALAVSRAPASGKAAAAVAPADRSRPQAAAPRVTSADSHLRALVRLRGSKSQGCIHPGNPPLSTVPPNTEEICAAAPCNGESHATVIERLFREHNEALVRFLRGRLGSRNEALEVAQEAYVRLLSLDQPGAVSYLRAFLFKTAANLAIDRRRRHHSYDKVTGRQLFMEFAENRTPERLVAGEQTLRHLGSLIESMPAKCRAAFVMSQIHGMDAVTIAARLGITDSMVRKYVVRALLRCREQMDLERND